MNPAGVSVLKRVSDCLTTNLQHVIALDRVQRAFASFDDDINLGSGVSCKFT